MAKGKGKPEQTAKRKTNNYILYDWETGGLDSKLNPVMEFAAIVLDGRSLEEIIRYDNLIKPYDSKLIYDPKAMEFTGITKEMCISDGIDMKQLGEDLQALFKEAGGGLNSKSAGYFPILVAHNAGFDNAFMQHAAHYTKIELKKYLFGKEDFYGNFQPMYIDTVPLCRQVWRNHDPGPADNKLQTACQYANIDIVDAHRAINDVESLTELFRYLVKQGGGDAASLMGTVTSGKFRETFQM